MRLRNSSKNKERRSEFHKRRKNLIVAGLIAAFLLFSWFFWYFIHPFLSYLYIAPIEHDGLDLYLNQTYLKYEDGEVFEELIQAAGVLEYGEPTNFYYCDSFLEDNPIHGKMKDVYILELDAGERYDACKENASTMALYEGMEMVDYVFFELEAPDGYSCALALDQYSSTIRLVLVTEVEAMTHDTRDPLVRLTSSDFWCTKSDSQD